MAWALGLAAKPLFFLCLQISTGEVLICLSNRYQLLNVSPQAQVYGFCDFVIYTLHLINYYLNT